ncbi:TIGR02453 family protein [Alphaproteobacteria bacterium 46_93_T64]|nr:TIGR02453 family protein [Alphaproteobacteria bacterium 46_93_T64]
MGDSFSGFSKELVKFYEDLSQNNDRDWFHANKQRYRDVALYPMCDFISAIAPHLEDIAPYYIADPRPNGGSVFRIYRDVRFSKDKKPYKEHLACQFRHQAGRDAHVPGFYIHFDLEGIRFGGGIWQPPTPKLALIRAYIDENPEKWHSVVDDEDFLSAFGGISGDGLKRAPKGYPIDHPDIEDLRRKTFFIMKRAPLNSIYSADLVTEVAATFQAASPFMKFMTSAVGLPF